MMEARMVIDPLDFSGIVMAPYVVTAALMLRRHFRKDGSGNRGTKDNPDPFAQTAFWLAVAAVAVGLLYFLQRVLYVFIPYSTIWFGALGVAWMGWAIWLQRRPPPPAVVSKELKPGAKKKSTTRPQKYPKAGGAGRFR
jgi:membrane protein implicated in regulation of membrane protease activity